MSLRRHYAAACDLQDELKTRVEELASEIARYPSQRDGDDITRKWDALQRYRSRLSSQYRALRKWEKPDRQVLSREAYREETRILRDIKALGRRLNLWERMDQVVQRHIDPVYQPFDLSRPPLPTDGVLYTLHMALHRLANTNDQDKSAEAHNCFPDIPMHILNFESLIRAAYRLLLVQGRAENARFLDIGCGGGTTLIAASWFFDQCDGIDFDPGYIEAAERSLKIAGAERCRAMEADGLTFEDYGTYDVIYFYRPIQDAKKLAQLEERVFSQARPGTIVLAPFFGNLGPRPDIPYDPVHACIFITGLPIAEAKALAVEAEHTDNFLVQRPRDLNFDTGFWTPLMQAASWNAGD